MQAILKWHRHKDDDRNPIVKIEERQYCGECQKHLTFRLGGEVVEIHTDEAGLQRIAEVIAEHPERMKQKAEAKVREAIAEAKRLGVEISEPASETTEPETVAV